jgi:hypothetical protein
MIKYYIDMSNYEKYGDDYLRTLQEYIFEAIMPMMKEDDFLDIHIVNWNVPMNMGIYRDKLTKYIPLLMDRLKSGINGDPSWYAFL